MKRSIWVPRQAVGHCAERPGIDAVAGARSETHPHRGRGACAGAFMRIWRAQGGGYGVSCPVSCRFPVPGTSRFPYSSPACSNTLRMSRSDSQASQSRYF